MADLQVSVVIPNWNQASLLANVLNSLKAQSLAPGQVIVVDNGSDDESVQVARAYGAETICLKTNAGFAVAVNAGIEAAQGEWILILNNDVELDREWIEQLLIAAAEEHADFAAGKLLQAGRPEYLDGTWDLTARSGCAWRCGWNSRDGDLWNARRTISMASLTACLIRREVFEKIGLLDTRYESYYEDVDLGLRMAMAGFTGVYEPRATAKHLGSATLGKGKRSTYLISRNQVLLAMKFGLSREWRWNVIVGQCLFVLTRFRQGTGLASLRGKWDGLRSGRHLGREPLSTKALSELLIKNEAEIHKYQKQLGFDMSWKLYFALCHV